MADSKRKHNLLKVNLDRVPAMRQGSGRGLPPLTKKPFATGTYSRREKQFTGVFPISQRPQPWDEQDWAERQITDFLRTIFRCRFALPCLLSSSQVPLPILCTRDSSQLQKIMQPALKSPLGPHFSHY